MTNDTALVPCVGKGRLRTPVAIGFRRLTLITALLLCSAGPFAPAAHSQQAIDRFSERIADMTNDRLRAYRETHQPLVDGWCESRLRNMNSLHEEVERRHKEFSAESLAAYRQALAHERAYPCPPGGPPTPPPPPPPPEDYEVIPELRAVMTKNETARINSVIRAADESRYGGDCASRDNRLTYARSLIASNAKLLGPDRVAQMEREIAAIRAQPCGPAAPTPPTVAQGLTQSDIDAVANQQSALGAAERESREAAAQARTNGTEVEAAIDLQNAIADSERMQPGSNPFEPKTEYELILAGGMLNRGLPTIGAGVIIEPGRERFAVTSDERIKLIDVGMELTFRLTSDSGLTFEGRIGRSNDRAANSVAAGTTPVGIVYHDRAPSGSTGINLGSTGIDAILERDSEYEWFGASYHRRIAGGDGKGPDVTIDAGLRYENRRTDIDSQVRSTAFQGISSTATQSVDENVIGLGLGLSFATGPGASSNNGDEGLLFFGDTEFRVEHVDSELDSVQQNLCNLCGIADRDFSRTIRDDDKRWGIGLSAELGLGYRLKSGLEIGIVAGVEYRSDMAGIRNPETGDDLFIRNQPTQLYFADSFGWRGAAYIGFAF